jgi:REP element-mobilizing transposase RayT
MSTYGHALYQLVYSTKYREKTIIKEDSEILFRYIWGILNDKKCHLYQIGGVEDHIHIIVDVHPTNSISDLIKDIKLASTDFIKRKNLFPNFNGWQTGYAYFTYQNEARANLIEYVKNQESHHHKKTFKEELMELLQEHGVEFDERYLD